VVAAWHAPARPGVGQGMDASHAMDVATAVERWRLAPHPEGGYFRETYRAGLHTVPAGWPGERALATAILYLLPAGQESAWHRVRGDELWLWQGGAPMELRIGDEARHVGPDPAAGDQPQVLVPAGAWQSATPVICAAPAASWSLVACLVVPGFDFADFELR
jgi:predicted cupin superfamily sugar epimerase